MHQSIALSIYPSIHASIHRSIDLFMHLSIYSSITLYIIQGGAELLIAAGFHYTTQSNSNTTTTTTTNINDINTNIICNHNDNTASNNEELYLIHSMTNEAEYRLAYTITR